MSRSAVTLAVATVVLTAACSTESADAEPVTSTPTSLAITAITRPDPIAIDATDEATRDEVVAELRAAADATRSKPVEIRLEMLEEEEERTATVRVDQERGLLEGEYLAPTQRGSVITTRHVMVDGRFFLKSTASAEAEAALDYTELPIEPLGADLIEEVFTAYGRLTPSLDRILLLLENLPIAVQVTELDNGREISVVMSPVAIYNFYGTEGIEPVGGPVHEEPTQFAFRIEDGVLVGIVAAGVHFHDGEALDVEAAITYTVIEPFALEVPPIEE